MQDEINWIPLGHRPGYLKHPDSEDYKCPVCGYEQYTIYMMPPKRCPRCNSEMGNGEDYKELLKEFGIMQDEMNDIQMPYTDPNPEDLVRVVRCKDCKHASRCYGDVLMASRDGGFIHQPLDYCSYGERKDGNA